MWKIITLMLFFSVTNLQAQSAKRMVKSIADHADEIQTVWPGFVESFNHAIYKNNGAIYLLSSEGNLAGWELKDQVGDLSIWYQKNETLGSFRRSFFLQKNMSPGIVVDGAEEKGEAIRTLFHESFHAFQDTTEAAPVTDWSDVTISEKVQQIKQAEFNLLTQILTAIDEQEKIQKINVYVSLRTYREGLMDAKSVRLERNMEWQEGVAAYVEFRVSKIIDEIDMAKSLVAYGVKLNGRQGPVTLEQFMRFDAYFHGAAICYVLNEHEPSWQQNINQGKTPFEMMLNIFPPSALDPADVEQGPNLTANNQDIKVDSFDALQAWDDVLIIDMNLLEGFNFVSQKMVSKSNGTLINRASKVYSDSDYLSLSATAKQMFLAKDQAFFKLSSAPKSIKNCEPVNNQAYHCEAGTKVKIKSIKLMLKKPMVLRRDGGYWYVDPSQFD